MEEADLSVDKPADPPPPDPVPSSPASASTSSAKKRRRYQQRHVPFAPPPKITPPATPAPVVEAERPLAPTSAEMKAKAYLAAQKKYTSDWHGRFPWLVLDKTDDGSPCLRCSVCMQHGKPTARYGRDGPGGRDLQIGSMRWHEESTKHEAYGFREMVKAMVAFLKAQQMEHIDSSPFIGISCDESTDRTRGKHLIVFGTFLKKRRVVTEFLSLLTIDKCDAASLQSVLLGHLEGSGIELQKIAGISTDGASVMTGEKNGLVARLRLRIPHLVGCHCIAHRILGAVIVVFIEYKHKHVALLKSFKFHFCLNFLADILAELNTLNRFFQRRTVDITLVTQEVDRTVTYIKHRYIEYGERFGGGLNKQLDKFLARYKEGRGSLEVHGIAADGSPCTHKFELTLSRIPGHAFGGTPSDCEDLCTAFAKETVGCLEGRLWDMKRMEGSKLYKVDQWPKKTEVRERRCRKWAEQNMALFDNKLPGVELRAMELELKTFCHIMKTHRKDDDFAQGLANMMKTKDWSKSYPNLMRMWQALAVLPLSTVECERGFSRQNVIKGWHRTSLCDATLGELMTISMLDYDMDYPQIVEKWRRIRHRRQARNVEFEQEIPLFPQQKDVVESSDDESVGGGSEDDNVDDDY
ncbi:hypothetical protein CLOP_g8164 [Closterium sp. NIES-67]|nr:hypothetical protein CLOP_g8164 [Closterium sp. NIES-67]